MPATLATIPPELKLKILENTYAKDVVYLRRVCRALRDIVDEHRERLDSIFHGRIIQEFEAFFHYHSFDGLSLLESLTRFLVHKGICRDAGHIHDLAYHFSSRYFAENKGPFDTPLIQSEHDNLYNSSGLPLTRLWLTVDEHRNLVECLIVQYLESWHGHKLEQSRDLYATTWLEFRADIVPGAVSVDDQRLFDFYHAAMALLANPTTNVHPAHNPGDDRCKFASLAGWRTIFLRSRRNGELESASSVHNVSRSFGRPSPKIAGAFEFRVDAPWGKKEVQRATWNTAADLDVLRKATVVEEMYNY